MQLTNFNISIVASGEDCENAAEGTTQLDKYALAKSLRIFHDSFPSPTMTLAAITARIIGNSESYQAKYERKSAKEKDYIQKKGFVAEV